MTIERKLSCDKFEQSDVSGDHSASLLCNNPFLLLDAILEDPLGRDAKTADTGFSQNPAPNLCNRSSHMRAGRVDLSADHEPPIRTAAYSVVRAR